ncbi:MAG: PadR family transcriptional regulator [Actinomycetaceae bacterium]|nr:PadR family transcriptional regulator [Actinomycetaceae bacterium]
MISSDVLRGYTDQMILRVLLDGDNYGYEISKAINEISGGTYVMKETTLYSAFKRLEKNGHINSYPGTVTSGKPRTYFTITPTGKEHYHHKIAEWRETKELVERFVLDA